MGQVARRQVRAEREELDDQREFIRGVKSVGNDHEQEKCVVEISLLVSIYVGSLIIGGSAFLSIIK